MKIKKLLLGVMVLALSLVLFACGEDEEAAHVHAWDNGTVTKEASCTAEGVKEFVCACGETKEEAIAKLDHTWGEGVITTEASCTAEGLKTFTCTCGETKTEPIAKLDHAHEWEHDAENHWKECACGDKTEAAAHVFGEPEVVREATCTMLGYVKYICECGYNYLERTDKVDHVAGDEVYHDEENHWKQCECSEKLEVTAHEWNEGEVTTEPTCTEEGVKLFTCACGATKEEVVEALGHSWDDGVVTTEPTCTEEGVKLFTCACTETKEEVIEKLPHVYSIEEVVTAPTVDTYGVYKHECECGDHYEDTIPLLGQVYFVPGPWAKGEERFAVYYWNASANGWADLTDADGDGIYEAKLDPAAAINVIFVRMNGSTTANNWDNKWDQTNDLVLPLDGTNLYTIEKWGNDTSWKGVGTWTTVVAPRLAYDGTFSGEVVLNPETGLYELPLSFKIWNRVSFTYKGVALTTENTTWEGLFNPTTGATWTEVLYTEDKTTWLCSRSAGADYIFTYDPVNNVANAVLGGLVWGGTWPGIAEKDNGVYVLTKTFAQWNRISLKFDNVDLLLDDITVTGDFSEGYTADPKLYYEDGVFLYGGTKKATFKVTFDPATKVLNIEHQPLGANQISYLATNADAECAIWTTAGFEIKDITGKYATPNGWRLFIVVDAEGKIAYMGKSMVNGYGGAMSSSYIRHSDYADYKTNPAFTNLSEEYEGKWGMTVDWALGVPEGGFIVTAHSGAQANLIELITGLIGDAQTDAAVNSNAHNVDNLRITYDAEKGIVSVNTISVEETPAE